MPRSADDPARPLSPLTALTPAELTWQVDDIGEAPHSSRFGDVYFSRHDGRAETEHVFIAGNDLPRRFADWQQSRPFVIGETGFGTGLNLLCAWACFETHAPTGARLHLISTERFPLARDDLARALSAWPDLAPKARRLLEQWPEPVSGVHRLWLGERVVLDLHLGDSAECLAQLDGRVDAWFLDGFAPSKNPEMWRPELFTAMALASRPAASVATFTCAGVVKRGLTAAGFAWRKAPGFGRKREMLVATLQAPAMDDDRRRLTPWFLPPPPQHARHVAVIGAGLAGGCVAQALARRGIRVTLLDREAPGAGASGNRQGALYVKLAAETNRQSRVYLAGLLHSRRWLAEIDPQRRLWQDCGVLQLATNERETRRQQRFLANHALPATVVEGLTARQASERAGLSDGLALAHGGLDYSQAGWVRPAALCQALAATPGVTFKRAAVDALRREASGWRLQLADGEALVADQVVIATATQANRFDQSAALPLQPIRGQLSSVTLPPGSPALERVVCAGGYVAPACDGILSFGASFVPNEDDAALREDEHAANLAELRRTLPGFVAALERAGARLTPGELGGRAAVRAASPDKTPYAGPVPDAPRWQSDYASLARDARRVPQTPGAHHPGLWISAAHGSRGLASAPLCAELIASRICDEPLPVARELADHLHPGRRLIADLVRGNVPPEA
ncbi:bifunctional tRNA (5-methylaminomethyl-2-thiouridine)(34)-methyltransferase MnmD/FAD-dependent 5-carboxymethylaminomethyl-2-thiouridine(34) oxidoreductase MnmC [Halomonas sp. HP20-15]|uniref:bifunctional tRNA (5-methylaminomethyl-2-thiouridine)(34)-methyltransferase MnmD/FAD-dependent 5-carboxymethylaminomethyl-2-thiouridine(34) oxidoreductase MnmC n=1 Tax=Halomonas sp. HP20-15 TaxID=3085901 RepID=UPI002980D46D|nr:bifunctional tRNA (5-methylaminomethyl-2-thiouridine)(34)-methyltransferase MnmD/FAD-dependent 5-carboxymethylaminomethyl-2-thiouridine(34) oxidoreductase MnmC [Halomonas sp. HP20-15]MDW5377306.1 bifunctional tRNA (5-methylaminomethyl-2-thiouridine)(34)-methyltransferase MnmD/FAD-dependent 5-carboxymethylaminomethyl-2-thiouridine(34) oxidoreductase MnmC [Halomonas sp. HP20-15]